MNWILQDALLGFGIPKLLPDNQPDCPQFGTGVKGTRGHCTSRLQASLPDRLDIRFGASAAPTNRTTNPVNLQQYHTLLKGLIHNWPESPDQLAAARDEATGIDIDSLPKPQQAILALVRLRLQNPDAKPLHQLEGKGKLLRKDTVETSLRLEGIDMPIEKLTQVLDARGTELGKQMRMEAKAAFDAEILDSKSWKHRWVLSLLSVVIGKTKATWLIGQMEWPSLDEVVIRSREHIEASREWVKTHWGIAIPKEKFEELTIGIAPEDSGQGAVYSGKKRTILFDPNSTVAYRALVHATALHEGIPGHFLHNWNSTPAREKLWTVLEPDELDLLESFLLEDEVDPPHDPFTGEGWAVYATRQMLRQAVIQDPRERLAALGSDLQNNRWAKKALKLHSDKVRSKDLGNLYYTLGPVLIDYLQHEAQKRDPHLTDTEFIRRFLSSPPLPIPAIARMAFGFDLPPLTEDKLRELNSF